MSAQLSPLFTWRSAIADSGLPPTQRLVALALSLHMNERGGSCFPTVEMLAEETGLHERSVQRARKALERSGWLRVIVSVGRGHANTYEACIPGTETVTRFPSPGIETVAERRLLREKVAEDPIKGGTVPPQDVKRTSEEKEQERSSSVERSVSEPARDADDRLSLAGDLP